MCQVGPSIHSQQNIKGERQRMDRYREGTRCSIMKVKEQHVKAKVQLFKKKGAHAVATVTRLTSVQEPVMPSPV